MTKKRVQKTVYSYELTESQFQLMILTHVKNGNNPPTVLDITDLGDSYLAQGFMSFTQLISKDWNYVRMGVGSIDEVLSNGLPEIAVIGTMRLNEPSYFINDKTFNKFLLDRGSILSLLKLDGKYYVNSNYAGYES
jgi:hypothetical protein